MEGLFSEIIELLNAQKYDQIRHIIRSHPVVDVTRPNVIESTLYALMPRLDYIEQHADRALATRNVIAFIHASNDVNMQPDALKTLMNNVRILLQFVDPASLDPESAKSIKIMKAVNAKIH